MWIFTQIASGCRPNKASRYGPGNCCEAITEVGVVPDAVAVDSVFVALVLVPDVKLL